MQASTAGSLMSTLPLIIVMVGLICLMVIPQRKKEKKVKAMLDALKPGDKVRTIGGLYGTITKVTSDLVFLQVGPEKVHLVFARGAISQVEDAGVENEMEESVAEK